MIIKVTAALAGLGAAVAGLTYLHRRLVLWDAVERDRARASMAWPS